MSNIINGCMKRLSFFTISLLLAMTTGAQTINLHMKNGEVIEYNLVEVDFVDFTVSKTEEDNQSSETFCPDNNHPHWIDLGLPDGTLWRCCNEGASRPEDYGGYYKFGEMAGAPTIEQMQILLDNTRSQWVTKNGVNGRKFIGVNGSAIFLPAAGYCWFDEKIESYHNVGNDAGYWSSTPSEYYPENGAYQLFISPERAYYFWDFNAVDNLSVRLVNDSSKDMK